MGAHRRSCGTDSSPVRRRGIDSYTSFGDRTFGAIPWTTLSWRIVHAGHLPLWNPYDALGMPFAFDFQSAAFSLPNIVSYLVPVHLAYGPNSSSPSSWQEPGRTCSDECWGLG